MRTLIFLLLMVMAGTTVGKAESQLLDRVVAIVNDEIITQSELDMLLRPIYMEYSKQFAGEKLFKELNDARLKLLNQLIEDRLVFQEAQDRGLEIDEKQVDARLLRFKSNFESDQEFEAAMTEQGLTLRALRDKLRKQEMIRLLQDIEIRSRIIVSPLEINEFYDDNPEEFTQKARVRVRSLTIKKSDEARKKGLKDEEAWETVSELKQRITQGEDFGVLAKGYSQDVHAEKDGLGDWVAQGEMIPTIDEIIFALGVSETSEVIETSMGYHLFRVENREDGKTLTFSEARDDIYGILFSQKMDKRFQSWMEELKSQSYISIR